MTILTAATVERYSECTTDIAGIVVRKDEIIEATSYLTSMISRFFSRSQGTLSTMQTITTELASSLEGLYSLNGKAAVIQFIDEHSFLIPLLMEAREKIAVYFQNSEVSLEVTSDPEAESDYQLLASVSTSLTAEDAYRRLKEFDRGWWLDELGRSQGLLCVSIDLQ